MSPEFSSYVIKYGYIVIFSSVFLQEIGVPNAIPNEFVLLFSGYLTSFGTLNFITVLITVCVADVVGTSLLYIVFYYFGQLLLQKWSKLIPTTKLEYLTKRVSNQDRWSIYIGRLIPFIRGYTSVAAGLLHIPPRIFLPAVLLSALTWSGGYVIAGRRFSDTLPMQDPSHQAAFAVLPVMEPEAPAVSANSWLMRHGWKQIWPLRLLGAGTPLFFAGPATQRYLRLSADDDYYIWRRQVDVDPHEHPILELTWSIERFPQEAALDVNDRTDRPLVVLVSFGPKVPSPGLIPSVPRGLAFFWGETETVSALYTCITPKNGPADVRLQCRYPHVKYIAMRRGG